MGWALAIREESRSKGTATYDDEEGCESFWDVYSVHDLNKHDVVNAFGLVGLSAVMDDLTMKTDTLVVSSYGGDGGGGEG